MSLTPFLVASDPSPVRPVTASVNAAADPALSPGDSLGESPAGPVCEGAEMPPEPGGAFARSLFASRGLFRR
jgi:hypothetical protein